ncbi:MAG: FAD-dependent oxidoreductase [Candidatus Brocadiae bacterium]|nr:FAD-dependent oxidoreductase [Candidatus Brocadiia bacterium]
MNESARKIPVAYEVDVVVVGGSTGAVAAAAAAAKAGAKVFLAAPRPYLGEDMAATMRLWLEPGEVPASDLAKAIFLPKRNLLLDIEPSRRLPFTYQADLPSVGVHQDTKKPSLLADGKWGTAHYESVQYNGDVSITADLGKVTRVEKAAALVYHANDFQVDGFAVSTSTDGRTWGRKADVRNLLPAQDSTQIDALPLVADVAADARYVRFHIQRRKESGRLLVGEVVVAGPRPAPVPGMVACEPVRPMHLKRTLDQALLDAGVTFLFGCCPTDVLRDADGKPAGIVMVNRAGRQAVVAKVIIDATDRAWMARMAGAKARPFPAGDHAVSRVVVGGEPREGEGIRHRTIQSGFLTPSGRTYAITETTLRLPMRDGGFASWAAAEQRARDLTFDPEQQFTSETLFLVPPDSIHGQSGGADELGAFRPAGVERVFVLGGCADVPREQAAALMRPLALIDLGARIGQASAAMAKALPLPKAARLDGTSAKAAAPGDVIEMLANVRPTTTAGVTVEQATRSVPVLGRYDVVVVGGGTAGAPAGIAAARHGAKTLVVEYLHGLGGVGTEGAISRYWYGYRKGFTAEVLDGKHDWGIEEKKEWWRRELRKAGADIWFGALGCGAFVDGDRVLGVVVATAQGRGVVLAKVVIDATGNADVAAAAGADTAYVGGDDLAMQGTGLPPRRLGARYTNTDFTITDETDMVDVWHLLVYAKHKYPNAFDLGQLIDTRERRRIVGDFTLGLIDPILGRTYPDTIVKSYSNYDTHAYTVGDYFVLLPAPKPTYCYTPYRCLLPKGLDGILVAGIGLSAHRDVMAFVRMQPDIQNQGYAAGAAAALIAKAGCPTRSLDVKALQRHLVEIGSLPKSVLTDRDSLPMPPERIAAAVASAASKYRDAAVLLAHPKQALPLIRKAYADSSGKAKLIYAHILAVLHDATGLPTLASEVEKTPWSDGSFTGTRMTRVDRLVVALGWTRDPRALPALLVKLRALEPSASFSHHRAIARALEAIGDPSAAPPLAELLAKAGMSGHAILDVDDARRRDAEAMRHTRGKFTYKVRNDALRELMLARALFRCGDHEGIGEKTLWAYAKDLRGHIARHAAAVLRKK